MRNEVDLIIVGAGAAGLAAARQAGELGLSYLVCEAMDRIGGRAYTESTTFGTPWDRGGHSDALRQYQPVFESGGYVRLSLRTRNSSGTRSRRLPLVDRRSDRARRCDRAWGEPLGRDRAGR